MLQRRVGPGCKQRALLAEYGLPLRLINTLHPASRDAEDVRGILCVQIPP